MVFYYELKVKKLFFKIFKYLIGADIQASAKAGKLVIRNLALVFLYFADHLLVYIYI